MRRLWGKEGTQIFRGDVAVVQEITESRVQGIVL